MQKSFIVEGSTFSKYTLDNFYKNCPQFGKDDKKSNGLFLWKTLYIQGGPFFSKFVTSVYVDIEWRSIYHTVKFFMQSKTIVFYVTKFKYSAQFQYNDTAL